PPVLPLSRLSSVCQSPAPWRIPCSLYPSLFPTGFARAGPVPGFQGDTLLLAFIDLRQLLDLFTQWDWSTYLADYGRPTCKYLRVNPQTALTLLEKMKDTSRKNNMFAQFRKNERDKQKLIDTVVKQLRNLIATNQA
uniref:Exocyst complex subunit EXOC6/Sec15 C-terminal domain-containing protein n=1 Tax=Cyprinus carpio TaxID=7962 RepID=A0A8C2F100_CYPCA